MKDEISDADLDVLLLDLSSQKSVADFAEKFRENYHLWCHASHSGSHR